MAAGRWCEVDEHREFFTIFSAQFISVISGVLVGASKKILFLLIPEGANLGGNFRGCRGVITWARRPTGAWNYRPTS